MPVFFEREFFNNTIGTYTAVFTCILLTILLRRFVSKYFAKLLYKVLYYSGKNLHKDAFVRLIIPQLDIFLLLFTSIIVLDKLNYPAALNIRIYKTTLFQIIDTCSNIAIIYAFVWLCLRIVDFIAIILAEKAQQAKDQTDNQLVIFFKDFFKAILVIIGVLLVLRFAFNKDIGNLITGLSIAGAALALATKESLENLIATFIIFFDKPFLVGDTVKVNAFSGIIEKIGLRSTRIRTEDKTFISVPNKQMVDSVVDNISLRTQRRGIIILEISLDTSSVQLLDLIKAIKEVLKDSMIVNSSVFLKDTGKTAHIIDVEFLTSMEQTLADFILLKQTVSIDIITLLETMQIDLAAKNKEIVIKNLPS